MNQAQRKFLIDTIKNKTEIVLKDLRQQLPKKPFIGNYLSYALINGTAKMKSEDEILKALKKKILEEDTKSLMRNEVFESYHGKVNITCEEMFVLPEDYKKALEEYERENRRLTEQIDLTRARSEGLCTRIQLASDKTLEKMIIEVDDMGDLSLVDCTLKNLMSPTEKKLIE